MTTHLRRLANRRNAQKSTGPKTEGGKRRAALNAQKHGMTAMPPPGLVAQIYTEIANEPLGTPDLSLTLTTTQQRALTLALAEARLATIKHHERAYLIRGEEADSYARDIMLVEELIAGDDPTVEPLTAADVSRGLRYIAKMQYRDGVRTRRDYRLMLRYREEAESRRATAFSDWISGIPAPHRDQNETKPT